MGFLGKLFGGKNAKAQGATTSDAMSPLQEPPSQDNESVMRRKDVEALGFAAYNCMHFIKRHNLAGMYVGIGESDTYADRVLKAFRFAAEKILPAKDVTEIFNTTFISLRKKTAMSDDKMRSVLFLFQLDQVIDHIEPEPADTQTILDTDVHLVVPLQNLKEDIQTHRCSPEEIEFNLRRLRSGRYR